jgi:protein-arginine kinase activator protein McsA
MSCVYCERPATYQAQAGLQRLRLCESCAAAWTRRTLGVPLTQWLRCLKPAPQTYAICPFCSATTDSVRETGLYGCPMCYLLLEGNRP